MLKIPSIIIIGGGAAGFFAAIRAAESAPEAKVTMLEGSRQVLNKVRISGGGRCNVTHACWEPRELSKHYPRGEKELLGPFHRFACGDTVDWFAKRGVELKIEEDGRMFPVSDSSQTIIDCLWESAKKADVEVIKGARMEQLRPPSGKHSKWEVITKGGRYYADRVMAATGSSPAVWRMLERLGHTIVPPVPSLFTFNLKDDRIRGLAGISAPKAEVRVMESRLSATGPLLITHWGMSGPGILRLSAWGARELAERQYRFDIQVNWLNRHPEDIREALLELKPAFAKKLVNAHPQFELPARLWTSLVRAAGIAPEQRWATLSKQQIHRLTEELSQGQFTVNGKSTFKEEFVTAGGVDLREVNFKTFESRLFSGLFFAGEVLNIDAVTGGFNFQAAWTGGWIAGGSMPEG